MTMTAIQKALYVQAKKTGLCVSCRARPAMKGGVRCASCAAQQRKASSRRRKKRKEEQRCTVCGKKSVSGRTRCKKCAKRDADIRHDRKQQGLCRSCGAETDGRARCVRCLTLNKRSYTKLKNAVFAHYGGYRCSCCGETHAEFLTIDHIAGNGNAHRREIGGNLYYWLKREGYPSGFRVLCMNCNWAIGLFGHCPHEVDNASSTS